MLAENRGLNAKPKKPVPDYVISLSISAILVFTGVLGFLGGQGVIFLASFLVGGCVFLGVGCLQRISPIQNRLLRLAVSAIAILVSLGYSMFLIEYFSMPAPVVWLVMFLLPVTMIVVFYHTGNANTLERILVFYSLATWFWMESANLAITAVLLCAALLLPIVEVVLWMRKRTSSSSSH